MSADPTDRWDVADAQIRASKDARLTDPVVDYDDGRGRDDDVSPEMRRLLAMAQAELADNEPTHVVLLDWRAA